MTNIKINKQYQHKIGSTKRGLIQRLINNTPFVYWCYCGRKVLFEKVCLFVCCSQVNVAWKTIFCQAEKGNRVKHGVNLAGQLFGLCFS